jgi:hypothetical protein
MPRLIPLAEFAKKLESFERNVSEASYFLEQGTAEYPVASIALPKGYRLLCSSKDHKGKLGENQIKIRLVHGDEIAYAVNLNVLEGIVNGKHCTQVMVWRSLDDKHEDALTGFARKMFEHFIEKYVVIVSDDEQTVDGRRFWQGRILNAFSKKMFVYFTDMNELDEDKDNIVVQIETAEEFTAKWYDHGWGESEEFKDRLFVISKEAIA